jgi:hypothetical protein
MYLLMTMATTIRAMPAIILLPKPMIFSSYQGDVNIS